MGLFSFIESAGRLLGIGHAAAAVQDESKPAPPPPAGDAIKGELTRLGLPVEGLNVTVDGNKATVTGNAPDAATRDKAVLAAGNIAGIAKVDDQIQVATPGPEPKLHTVVKGETLSAIAATYLGSASKYPVIFEANKPMLSDPNKIYPGQVLRIPEAA